MRPSNRLYAWLPAFIIGMTVVALIIGGLTLYYIEGRLVAATGESLALAAADIADKLDRTLSERHNNIQGFARAGVFQGHDPKAKSEYVTWLQQRYPFYLWLAVTNARGTVIAATNPNSIGKDRSAHEWFSAIKGGRTTVYVLDAQVSEDSDGVMAVRFAAPIKDSRGEFLGVVTTLVGLPAVEDVFTSTTRTLQLQRGVSAGKIEWQFMTRDGEVIVDSALRQEGAVNLKTLGVTSALLTGSAQSGYIEETHLRRQVEVISGYAQTEQSGNFLGLHWGVLVRMDRSDVVAPIRTVLWKLGLAEAVVFVPSIGFLIWTTRRLRQEWTIAQEEAVRAKTAEAVTQEVQEWLVTILKSIGDAVIVTDKNGSVTFMNAVAESLTGWKEKEAKGQPLTGVFQIVNEKTRQPAENPAVKAMREGVIVGLANHTVLIAKDGAERPIDDSGAPIRDAQGSLIGVVLVFRDITERKRAEAKLQKAKEAAETANVAKSEFLASMSHEIRTPMNAIIGMTDLLAETPLAEEQRNYVRICQKAGDSLLTLINDILDFSKVEAGHVQLEVVDFDLHELLEGVADVMAVRAHEKGLDLACHIPSDVPAGLVGDPTRLRQILINLLGNAVKFTERGEVVLRVDVEPSPLNVGAHSCAPSLPDQEGAMTHSPAMVLRFSVRDTGIGIPAEKFGAVFERFTQADSSTTRKYGGTGLGLTISKRLVELMGGRIRVESEVGRGTVFSLAVPLGVWTGPKRRVARTPVDLKNLNVLVVDDNDTNRLILKEMLMGWHARVTEVAGGEEALQEFYRARGTGDPYRLVLLDCRMPGMDGFQVAEAITREQSLAGLTLMMLTSDARSGDTARAREMGMTGYLVKPVKRADLLNAITAALNARTTATHVQAPPTVEAGQEPLLPTLHILLVEDSPDNRALINAYLKQTPYQADIAENGVEAVEQFKVGHYDLVLMDMQMPVMDGYTATQEIREWEQANHRPLTPIIALTAHALKGDEEKTLAAGCTAHITKPIKKTALLGAIAEHTKGVPV